MPDSMLVWVTRSAPFNIRTRRALQKLGHRAVTVPALATQEVVPQPPGLEAGALAFTSGHALRYHRLSARERDLPVFAVGDHTASLARAIGCSQVRSAGGDIGDLRNLILGSLRRDQHLVHVGAREPAGDLVGDLRRAGFSAERQIVYESVPISSDQLGSIGEILRFIDAIIVHSFKGAGAAAKIVRARGWEGTVFCLSDACASRLNFLPGIRTLVAREPTEDALMDLIRDYPGNAEASPEIVWPGRETERPYLRLIVSNDRPERKISANDSFDGPELNPPPAA